MYLKDNRVVFGFVMRNLAQGFNSPLQIETVTKILIKMLPLSTDGAILILLLT